MVLDKDTFCYINETLVLNTTLAMTTTLNLNLTLNYSIFTLLTQQELMILLVDSKYDISECLTNCSTHGTCVVNVNSRKFECSCTTEYFGSSCKFSKKICSNNLLCLNQGQCIDTNTSYRCECAKFYYGSNCEFKVDTCFNVTCSNHGNCLMDKSNQPLCQCFQYYYGTNCENRKIEIVLISTMIKLSSIIAIIFLVLTYLLAIISDILELFRNKKIKKYKYSTNKILKMKFYYSNN